MSADNYAIADQFSLLAKLMDIHGENSFKAKSFSSAAFTIEKLPLQLKDTAEEKIFGIKGIGDSIGKKILEILRTGELKELKEIISRTPPGILDMMQIKGIGPKKIATIWKELEIESLGELLYACNENRLTMYKGFGEKTQQNIKEAIEFFLQHQDSFLFAAVEAAAASIQTRLLQAFPGQLTEPSGDLRRQSEIINQLDFCTTIPAADLKNFFLEAGFTLEAESPELLYFKTVENLEIRFQLSARQGFGTKLFVASAGEEFLETWKTQFADSLARDADTEEEIFSRAGIPYLEPWLREKGNTIERAQKGDFKSVIEPGDIRAIIHSHSNWSDGNNTIEEMALAAKAQGLEYLVISDHSKSAFYANGLSEERIVQQHKYVDELNSQLAPFRIFKSIESDILNDGSLDYPDEVLARFDLVIASVHSNLKMPQEKAMMRLLTAISNPYTTILGHMTGRLLLSRPGYPVDHRAVIDACAAHHVVIELNAHPRRLDMDWRWIDYALEKDVLISINPDAHSVEGYADTRYGVLAARKAGLPKEKNLSSFSLAGFENYLSGKKKARS